MEKEQRISPAAEERSGWVDVHCHLLPGVDDGASTLEEALEMARMAVEEGISDILCTPHTHNGIYHNRREEILTAVEKLQEALRAAEIPLRVHPGAEVHIHGDLLDHLQDGEFPTLNDAHAYILLELPFMNIPPYTDDLLYELHIRNITTLLAHPERNAILRVQPQRLAAWIEEYGVVAQLTAGSLLGHLGERTRKAAEQMVRQHLVHVVASDAHNTGRRPLEIRSALERLREWGGEETVRRFQENARAILRGEPCQGPRPLQRKGKKRFFFF